VKHTSDFGAHIVIDGATLSESGTRAKSAAAAHGFTLIHPYDDPLVIAGQGTTALEFLEQAPELDMLVVPVGGGGLISGMAIAARARKPDIRFMASRRRITGHAQRANGGESPQRGPDHRRRHCREGSRNDCQIRHRRACFDVLLVGEADIEAAIVKLLEVEKTLAEGAGAAALAAVLAHPAIFNAHRVGIVISGGNIDMRLPFQCGVARARARGPHPLFGDLH